MSVLLLLGLVAFTAIAFSLAKPAQTAAATNNVINFQARLETNAGAIVPDGNYNVEFKLYSASSGGSALWTEDYLNSASQGISVANGYLTANLGSITAFPTTINWDQQLWLTMNIGGTTTGSVTWDGEMNPRLQLTALPYAFRAGKLADPANSGSTLGWNTQTSANSILLPNEAGTLCIENSTNCGFATSTGSGSYIQNGTSVQSGANFNISGNGTVGGTLQAATVNGTSAIQLNGTDINTAGTLSNVAYLNQANVFTNTNEVKVTSPTAFQIQNSTATSNLFVADTSNSVIGIGETPTSSNGILQLSGALTLNGGTSGTTNFLTPVGSHVPTAINIPLYDPGAYGQILALGLPSGADYRSRAISIFDDRTSSDNQPAIGVFNTNETNILGLSWDGSTTTGYLKTLSGGALGFRSGGTTLLGLDSVGNATLTGDLQVQGGDITTNQTSFNLLNTTATTLNIGGDAGTGGINLAGGSSSTGCTIDGSNGNLACSGNITGAATGTVGYWSRSGTTLQPANSGDNITTSGTISTTGSGTITSAGLLTGSAGLTVTGAAVNLNASSNFATNINTGTSTGAINIGNTSAGAISLKSGSSGVGITSTSATALQVSDGTTNYFTLDTASGTGNGTFNLGNTTSQAYIKSSRGSVAGIPYWTLQLGDNQGSTLLLDGNDANNNWTTTNGGIALNSNGGALTLQGTSASLDTTGSSTVSIGTTHATGITIGRTGQTVTMPGTLNVQTGYQINGTAGASSISCSGGQLLQNATVAGGIVTGGSCATGGGSGVTTVGTLDGGTLSSNGAYISGTTIYLQSASGSYPGLVNTTTQTLAGAKTFSSLLTGSAGLTVTGAAVNLNASSNFATNINTGTSTGAVGIGNSAAGAVTIASGAASSFTTAAGNLTLQAGSGTVTLGSSSTLTNTGALTITGGSSLTLQSTSTNAVSLDSGTTGAVNIGTSANNKTITVGNSTATGATQTINIGYDASAGATNTFYTNINIGTASNSSANTTIQAGYAGGVVQIGGTANTAVQTINVGTNLYATQTVAIGSKSATSSTTTIQGGSGSSAILEQAANGGTITIGNQGASSANTVNIGAVGSVANADTVNIGTSSGAVQTLTIGSTYTTSTTNIQGGTSGSINIGATGASTNASTVHIADQTNGSGNQTVSIGSTNGSSTTLIQGGTPGSGAAISLVAGGAGIAIGTNSTAHEIDINNTTGASKTVISSGTGGISLNPSGTSNTGVTVKPGTDSTAAFQIQNALGTNTLFAADTANSRLTVSGSVNVGTLGGNRLFSDGFESGNTALWSTSPNNGTISTSTVYDGKYSVAVSPANNTSGESTYITASSTVYESAWVNVSSQTSSTALLMEAWSDLGTGSCLMVQRTTAGAIAIYNCQTGSTVYTSASGILPLNAWHQIQLGDTVGSTTGTTQVWLDGTLLTTLSSQHNGAMNINGIQIGSDTGTDTYTAYFDDVVADTSQITTPYSGLNVDDSLHVGGTSSFGNNVLVQSASNSSTAFQVQNTSGVSVLSADTSGMNVNVTGTLNANGLAVAGGASAPTVIGGSTLSGTNSATRTIATNSSTQTGDLVIITAYIEPANEGGGGATYGTLTLPSGVTLLPGFPINTDDYHMTSYVSHRLYVWYYYATANGSQNLTFTDSNSGVWWGLATATIRGGATSGNPLADPANTNTISGTASGVTTTPPVSLNLGSTNSLVLWAYGDWSSHNSTLPSGYSNIAGSGDNPGLAQHTYASAGSTGTVDATASSGADNGMTAALLSFRPGTASNILNVTNSSGTSVGQVTSSGDITLQGASSPTALQVNDSSGNTILGVDTATHVVNVGGNLVLNDPAANNSSISLYENGAENWQIGTDDDKTCGLGQGSQSLYFYTTAGGCALEFGYNGQVLFYASNNTQAFQIVSNSSGHTVFNVDTNNDRIGIGDSNTTPSQTLSVIGTLSANQQLASFTNLRTTNSTNTQLLRLAVGTAASSTSARFVQFYAAATSDSNGTAVGHINLNNSAVNYATSGADYAEWFDSSQPNLPVGNIVEYDNGGVKDAQSGNTNIIGTVSDTYGFTGDYKEGDETNPYRAAIGLTGQVKVNVTGEAIEPGDPIGVSSTPGIGQKALAPGEIVGYAEQAFAGGSSGTIIVYLSPGYWPGPSQSSYLQNGGDASLGNLTVNGLSTVNDLQANGTTTLNNLIATTGTVQNMTSTSTTTNSLNVGGDANIGNLIASGTITANNLSVTGTTTVQDLTAASVSATTASIGDLSVSGGLTVAGSITTSAINVTGSASVGTLSVSGDAHIAGNITIGGHIITSGQVPAVQVQNAAGNGATCTLTGNDTGGFITIATGNTAIADGAQCIVTFHNAYAQSPNPVVSPRNKDSAGVGVFVDAGASTMNIDFAQAPAANTTYVFNYFNAQ